MEEFRNIDYKGTNVTVGTNGTIIWNGTRRNHYFNKDGYPSCSIKTNVGWRSVSIHRLIAIAFIPNPNNLPEINHKDYDRKNFSVENLEWVDRLYNVRYSICNKPDVRGKNNPNYGNKKLSKIYKSNPEYSKEKQGRPGLKNGRCRKIKLYVNNTLINEFDYIMDCCEYIKKHFSPKCSLNGIRSQIDKSIRDNKPYKNMCFIKE